jgi:ribosomal protein S11
VNKVQWGLLVQTANKVCLAKKENKGIRATVEYLVRQGSRGNEATKEMLGKRVTKVTRVKMVSQVRMESLGQMERKENKDYRD